MRMVRWTKKAWCTLLSLEYSKFKVACSSWRKECQMQRMKTDRSQKTRRRSFLRVTFLAKYLSCTDADAQPQSKLLNTVNARNCLTKNFNCWCRITRALAVIWSKTLWTTMMMKSEFSLSHASGKLATLKTVKMTFWPTLQSAWSLAMPTEAAICTPRTIRR